MVNRSKYMNFVYYYWLKDNEKDRDIIGLKELSYIKGSFRELKRFFLPISHEVNEN